MRAVSSDTEEEASIKAESEQKSIELSSEQLTQFSLELRNRLIDIEQNPLNFMMFIHALFIILGSKKNALLQLNKISKSTKNKKIYLEDSQILFLRRIFNAYSVRNDKKDFTDGMEAAQLIVDRFCRPSSNHDTDIGSYSVKGSTKTLLEQAWEGFVNRGASSYTTPDRFFNEYKKMALFFKSKDHAVKYFSQQLKTFIEQLFLYVLNHPADINGHRKATRLLRKAKSILEYPDFIYSQTFSLIGETYTILPEFGQYLQIPGLEMLIKKLDSCSNSIASKKIDSSRLNNLSQEIINEEVVNIIDRYHYSSKKEDQLNLFTNEALLSYDNISITQSSGALDNRINSVEEILLAMPDKFQAYLNEENSGCFWMALRWFYNAITNVATVGYAKVWRAEKISQKLSDNELILNRQKYYHPDSSEPLFHRIPTALS